MPLAECRLCAYPAGAGWQLWHCSTYGAGPDTDVFASCRPGSHDTRKQPPSASAAGANSSVLANRTPDLGCMSVPVAMILPDLRGDQCRTAGTAIERPHDVGPCFFPNGNQTDRVTKGIAA